jgi:hypothetical protein
VDLSNSLTTSAFFNFSSSPQTLSSSMISKAKSSSKRNFFFLPTFTKHLIPSP